MRPSLDVSVSSLPPSNGITVMSPPNGRGRVSTSPGSSLRFRPLLRADRGDGTGAELTHTECRGRDGNAPPFTVKRPLGAGNLKVNVEEPGFLVRLLVRNRRINR